MSCLVIDDNFVFVSVAHRSQPPQGGLQSIPEAYSTGPSNYSYSAQNPASPPHRHVSPDSTSASASGPEQTVLDPTRKSRFDYYSPFDALSASAPPLPQPAGVNPPKATSPPPPASQLQQSPVLSQQQPQQQQQLPMPSYISSGGSNLVSTRKKPVPPEIASGVSGNLNSLPAPQHRPTSPRIQEIQAQAQQMSFQRRGSTPEGPSGTASRGHSDAEAGGFERPTNPGTINRPMHIFLTDT